MGGMYMLIRYELKKILAGKIKWIILTIIILNALFYYYSLFPCIKTEIEKQLYQEMIELGEKHTSIEVAYKNIKNDMIVLSLKYGGSKAELSETELKVCNELEEEYLDAINFEEFKSGIAEHANNLLNFSIFSKEKSFSYRNIIKTVEDYKDIEKISVEPVDGRGLIQMNNFFLSDILIIIIICLLAFQIYGVDSITGINKIIKSTVKGSKSIIIIELSVVSLLVTACAFMIYGSNLIQTSIFVGFPNLKTDIHGIEAFQNIPYSCSIGYFLLMFFGWKLLYSFSVSFLLQYIVYKFKGTKIAWAIIGGLSVLSFLLWFFLPSNPIAVFFRYINIIGLADTGDIIGTYQNLNLLGYPVSLKVVSFVILILLVCVNTLLMLYTYPFIIKSVITNKKNPFAKQTASRLIKYEVFKVYIVQHGILVLLFAFLFTLYTGLFSDQQDYLSKSEYYYEQFSNDLLGKKGNDLKQSIAVLSKDNNLLSSEGKLEAYTLLQEQCDYLLNHPNKDVGFVNARRWNKIFFNKQDELGYYIFFCIISIFAINKIFQIEYKNRLITLIRTTPNGGKVYWYKLLIVCFQSIIFSLLIQIAQIWKFEKIYSFNNGTYAVQSLPAFTDFPLNITIQGMLYFVFIQRMLVGLVITIVLFLLAQLLISSSQLIVTSSILFIIPAVLLYVANSAYNNPLTKIIQSNIEPYIKYIYQFSSWPSVYKETSILHITIIISINIIGVIAGFRFWKKK